MENRLDIIRFNDDNHAERIWVDGEYIGDLSDIEYVFKNFIDIIQMKDTIGKIVSTAVYVCDDFDDFDEEDEIVDNIWNWFNEVELMTQEQIEKVHNKNWRALNDLID